MEPILYKIVSVKEKPPTAQSKLHTLHNTI